MLYYYKNVLKNVKVYQRSHLTSKEVFTTGVYWG